VKKLYLFIRNPPNHKTNTEELLIYNSSTQPPLCENFAISTTKDTYIVKKG